MDERRRAGGIPRTGWLLLALALGLRLAWAFVAPVELFSDHIFNDATARGIAAGHGFTASFTPPFHPAVFRAPGYSAFVAAIYRVVPNSVRAVFLVQAILDALTCLLIGRLAFRRLGPRAAWFALALAATYPFTIHAVGSLSAETLLVFLATALLYRIDSWPSRSGWAAIVADGVLLGAIVWVKPVFLPIPAVLFLAERLRGRTWRLAAARAALVGGIAAALLAPWVARNEAAFGRPVLAGELGIVVWHGTYDFSEERDRMIAEGFANEREAAGPGATYAERYESTRRRYLDSKALLERDQEYLERGLARVRAAPLRALLLDPLRRIPRLWVSTTYSGGPAWVGYGAAAACVGYLLLAVVGLWRLRGRWSALAAWWVIPVALTLSYAALHVEARYTLPARPTMLLLGAAALGLPRRSGAADAETDE